MNPTAQQKIDALLVIYLTALMQSPGLTEEEYHAAEQRKAEIAARLP